MKNLILLFGLIFLFMSCTVSNTKENTNVDKAVAALTSVTFDQKLADSLGGDERGMKNYMLVILKTGPNDSKITDKAERAELFKGHFSNMETMQNAGKLKMAGPFASKNDLNYRGIFLLDVKTEEEARALLQSDPTIAKGIFEVEILPFYGSAAIPMHLKYHSKISKSNP